LAEQAASVLARADAALLACHGVIVVAATPTEALRRCVEVERRAAAAWSREVSAARV
jgi:ribulose-5-phosphate 4-epimerase/fuculose-1-phosphate aldolase